MKKICIVGAGQISLTCHGPSLRKYVSENPSFELAAVCDLDENKARNYARQFGFKRVYQNLELMLTQENPAALYVIVPVPMTADLAQTALKAHVPVFMEKPPAMTDASLQSLMKVASSSRTLHFVGFNRRHAPLVKALHALLDQEVHKRGEKIHSVRYEIVRHKRQDADFSTTAIHGIDAARFLSGSDYEETSLHYQDSDQSTNVYLQGRMTDGTQIHASFIPSGGIVKERAVIHSSNQTFELDVPIWKGIDCPGEIRWYKNDQLQDRIAGTSFEGSGEMYIESGFFGETQMFLDGIQQNTTSFPSHDFASARSSVQIMEAMRERKASVCCNPSHSR